MKTKISVLGFFALAALAFAGPAAKAPAAHPRIVPAGTDARLLSAVAKANSDFEIAITKGDVSTIVEPYTSDAVFVSPDGTSSRGRDQIAQLYRDRFAKSGPPVEARIESEELMLGGDFAYERGRGALTRLENGKRVTNWVGFLTVWQRQPDGNWNIFRNIVLPGR